MNTRKTAKVLTMETKEVLDRQTGETISQETNKVVRIDSEPPFVKLYMEDIACLNGLPKSSSMLLFSLVRRMDWDGDITLVANIKKQIAKEVGITEKTIRNYLLKFAEQNIIKRVAQGQYRFNPKIFAKGDWSAIRTRRAEFMQLHITYTQDGKRVINNKIFTKDK